MQIIIHTLTIAIFTIFWEVLLRHPALALISKLKRSSIRKNLLKFKGDIYISKSIPMAPKPVVRLSDTEVEKDLENYLNKSALIDNEPTFDIDNPNINLIILGSTRYNKHAQELQKKFSIQFEYIFDLIEGEPPKEILRLVNKYGDTYFSSVDLDKPEDHFAIDYGILFHAILNNQKRVLWFSGIHGIGTIGVYKYFKENPTFFAEKFNNENSTSLLLRVKYDPKHRESMSMIKSVEIIGTADSCERRSVNKPSTIICDLGNVIMLFDRNRTYRAIAHWLGRPQIDIKQIFDDNVQLRDDYEKGVISDDEFFNSIIQALDAKGEIDFKLFAEFWADIFWPNKRVITLLKVLKSEYTLVLLSNTNKLQFQDLKKHYADIINLFDGKLILSYETKIAKPDEEVFQKAIRVAGNMIRASECVYIDDKSEYVEVAKRLGMRGIVYSRYAQLVHQLRSIGVYSDVNIL
jgi:putative hydrolase of the HAD superfamily